eukprot:SAG11_NODE_1101_length_5868_cov_2.045935_4_plen_69_part_00
MSWASEAGRDDGMVGSSDTALDTIGVEAMIDEQVARFLQACTRCVRGDSAWVRWFCCTSIALAALGPQ